MSRVLCFLFLLHNPSVVVYLILMLRVCISSVFLCPSLGLVITLLMQPSQHRHWHAPSLIWQQCLIFHCNTVYHSQHDYISECCFLLPSKCEPALAKAIQWTPLSFNRLQTHLLQQCPNPSMRKRTSTSKSFFPWEMSLNSRVSFSVIFTSL